MIEFLVQAFGSDIELAGIGHYNIVTHKHTRGKGGLVFAKQNPSDISRQAPQVLISCIDQYPV